MITLEKDGDLWIARLSRPEKANSLTAAMLKELGDIALAAREARALILTGEGKAFSAGMDLEAAKTDLPTSPLWERLSGAIANLPGVSIAALNGTVAGGAMGMVLACDMRLAVPAAKAFYPVMRLGFLPQPSDPARLVRLIGPARAKLILMGGQKVSADEALAWGLFDRIVEPDALVQEARDLAADSLGATAEHAAAIKALIG
jgi:enoyl-CoA hydratase/carnithine racemase